MDQDAFRRTYRDVNERFCAYENSILTNQCNCSQARRFCIAEREGVRCLSAEGQTRCLEFLRLLRERARFSLKTDRNKPVLPHGKAMRVQVGGMRGLAAALSDTQEAPPTIGDIFDLIGKALAQFHKLENLPYSRIMQHIAAYRGRPRSRQR